ncbi:hypothetical protein DKG77_11770 [Flagellimonas aquimarina]|uniref:Uncharacterized protein n=1 Tax=Flagellimonas aquimarina TaxID=2201895 RepID=A0A316L1P1_9FLAO|nr:S8 family serine peptidase [Allomuricauda koreensis]PWL38905.1 hypothetical protein DKG77_11770 [Allomuricauda koreensis]
MKKFNLIIDKPKLHTKSDPFSPSEELQKDGLNAWDEAHNYRNQNKLDYYVEPEIDEELFETEFQEKPILKSDKPQYLDTWPLPPEITDKFVWHLHDQYSELAIAHEKVKQKIQKEKYIKIAHIDTGYQPGHDALPEHLDEGISFVKGEIGKSAIDTTNDTFAEQDGHGTATMSILAGKTITFSSNGHQYKGYFGGIPFAEIIPIRISDTVALIRSQNFVKAIEYAIQRECDVISMSMAGAPTKEWAKAVNKAYNAGITLVTAAGNSWNKGGKRLLPKKVLYPARWERVIAATGATSNHKPYVFDAQLSKKSEGGETMQGNFGPKRAMKSAIAAYTPNTPWPTMNEAEKEIYYRFDGGGTSTATPQVAAAAALWLSYYKDEIESSIKSPNEKWKKVEAVKHALFESADKTTYDEWARYYGKGILKANKALGVFPDFDKLKKAKKAKTSLNGILDLLGIMLRLKNDELSDEEITKNEMFSTEILQLLHTIPELHEYLDINDEDEKNDNVFWSESDKQEIVKIVLKSDYTSDALKQYLMSKSEFNTSKMNLDNAFALLIGVGADLPVTIKDAQALAKILSNPTKAAYNEENIQLLTGSGANRIKVLEALEKLAEKTSQIQDATVIIYYSGHGGIYADEIDNTIKENYYMLTNGFDKNNRAETMVSGTEFSEAVDNISAQKLLVMLDCCHAAGMLQPGQPLLKLKSPDNGLVNSNIELLKKLNSGEGKVFITSCDDDEQSVILPGSKNSLFTEVIIEALEGKASRGYEYVNVIDILSHVFKQVPERVDRFNHKQRPIINKIEFLSPDYFVCKSAEFIDDGNEILVKSELEFEQIKTFIEKYNIENSHSTINVENITESTTGNKDKNCKELVTEVESLIFKAETFKAIKKFHELTQVCYTDYIKDARFIAFKYNSLYKDKMSGILEEGFYQRELLKITKDLEYRLSLCD